MMIIKVYKHLINYQNICYSRIECINIIIICYCKPKIFGCKQ